MANIRPRRKKGAAPAKPARGFPHPIVKALMKASTDRGYVTRRGTPDFRRLSAACNVSWRMLYYAGAGANLSLRALEQWADVVGIKLVTKKG